MAAAPPVPPKGLLERLRAAPVRAPEALALAACEQHAPAAKAWLETKQGRFAHSPAELSDMAIRKHAQYARASGAITGLGGWATMAPDLAALAWIQIGMVLIVAALYGHDLKDKARLKELFTLTGVYGAGSANVAGDAAARGAQRVAKRLVLRHLRGENLQALKALFRLVGINFARAGVIRALPLVNIPMNAVVNDAATRTLGRKARAYYSTLPASSSRQAT